MPAFQGSWDAPLRSRDRAIATRDERVAEQRASIEAAKARYGSQ
jgi:hypothetical protein